jgi:glycosyltransferase involved in cell wall biosynthesis
MPDSKVITHGVDTTVFKPAPRVRDHVREIYGVKQTDTLLINIGSMTQNKGIELVLEALAKFADPSVKVLFKGSGDLYASRQFLDSYIRKWPELQNSVIFVDGTLSYKSVRYLFAAADAYASPYLAEGFNLTVLEALSCGLPVIVPRTGSTREFVHDIHEHGGAEYINYVDSNVVNNGIGYQNTIAVDSLVTVIQNLEKKKSPPRSGPVVDAMREYIQAEYSWAHVSDLLYAWLCDVGRMSPHYPYVGRKSPHSPYQAVLSAIPCDEK